MNDNYIYIYSINEHGNKMVTIRELNKVLEQIEGIKGSGQIWKTAE